MLVKGLGAIDVIAGLLLFFAVGIALPTKLLLLTGIVLLAKSSLGKLKDFASWIDFLAGIIFLLNIIISVPVFISVIAGILLLQKGLFSFI